jgi:S-disulfanyl-L-cysteine oxidoreductase SoxD
MFKHINFIITIVVSVTSSAYAATYTNVGRLASPAEIAAWDIDVRPDFKGLPSGSGSVEEGEEIWEAKCVSCHGTFGESNEVFTPIIGGTTKADITSGRVAGLVGNSQPQKTTIMKVATLSTLWDYINRAMPWTAPKSLSTNEVFAVTAYILNLARIIPDDFTLSNKNIEEVQKLMPNRNGMTLDHGLRTVNGNPDVRSNPCMSDCKTTDKITSTYPESARESHGNIQHQNRTFGAVRGIDTTMPSAKTLEESIKRLSQAVNDKREASSSDGDEMLSLAKKSNCLSCHGISNKLLGPSFNEIATKYKLDSSANDTLFSKVRKGTSGNWGNIPMPPQTAVSDADAKALVNWILKRK